MRTFDDQERAILKALIRDPRQSDNYISKITGVPTPTARRKRKRLEEEGLLSYFTAVDLQESGTGTFGARHLAWGSNYPSSEGKLPELLKTARESVASLSQADRDWIFAKTAQSLYPALAD